MTPEQQYNVFRDSGDLEELFPKLSGEWNKDKARFTKMFEKNNQILEDLEKDLQEEEE